MFANVLKLSIERVIVTELVMFSLALHTTNWRIRVAKTNYFYQRVSTRGPCASSFVEPQFTRGHQSHGKHMIKYTMLRNYSCAIFFVHNFFYHFPYEYFPYEYFSYIIHLSCIFSYELFYFSRATLENLCSPQLHHCIMLSLLSL